MEVAPKEKLGVAEEEPKDGVDVDLLVEGTVAEGAKEKPDEGLSAFLFEAGGGTTGAGDIPSSASSSS